MTSREEWRRMKAVSSRKDPKPLPRPTLGARIQCTPTLGFVEETPLPCTVIDINDQHHHYTVQFDAGYRQTYQWGTTK